MMKTDVAGRVHNTKLHPSNALMPLFEAVVNSIQSLEGEGSDPSTQYIRISVDRQAPLLADEPGGAIHGCSVTDNGGGFNRANLDAFFTSDTRQKADLGGKGIGRFVWLKEFGVADIESHYREDDRLWLRSFSFSEHSDEPTAAPTPSTEVLPRTTVHLRDMKEPFQGRWPRELEQIAQRLVEHCLNFFMNPNHPTILLTDGQDTIDVGDWYAENFAIHATSHSFSVGGITFHMRGFRRFGSHAPRHELVYAAHSRKVMSEYLGRFIPNLQRKLQDDGRPFVYMGFIESEYLDENVNGERTAFSFPTNLYPEEDRVDDIVTLESIREQALQLVSQDLHEFLYEMNAEKKQIVEDFVRQAAPRYRHLLPHLDEFLDRMPPGSDHKALDSALRSIQYDEEERVSQESNALRAAFSSGAMKPEEYEDRLTDVVQRSNDIGKSSLAQYVGHRKVMLDFLEESLQTDPGTRKYPLEKMVHRIIYPMGVTSDEVRYEDQNLWIIDERLSYHAFLASDLRLKSWKVLNTDSSDRPDLALLNMFDTALGFRDGADEGALSSIVIIEFKRPMRQDFGAESPLQQVIRLLEAIRAGQYTDEGGRPIRLQSPTTPAFLYVISDLTPEVEAAAKLADLRAAPDNIGYFGFNSNFNAYVEVISYTKLLSDAKKRNRVLFDKLFAM